MIITVCQKCVSLHNWVLMATCLKKKWGISITAFNKPDTAPKGTEHLVWVFILMSCPKMQRDFHSFLLNRSHYFRSWLLKNAVKWFQSKQAEKSCNSPLTYLLNSLKSVRARFTAYLWGCTHNAIYRGWLQEDNRTDSRFSPSLRFIKDNAFFK